MMDGCCASRGTAEWLDHVCRLNGVKEQFTFYDEGQVVACGFGVIEREYIGLYDIVTDMNYRNRGFGEQMILNLLKWGKEQGANHSYLAVVSNNAPARRLYAKLGYSEVYTYGYRVRNFTST